MPRLIFQTGLRRKLGLEEMSVSSGPVAVRELLRLGGQELGTPLLEQLTDARGELFPSVMILLNGRNIRLLGGLDTMVRPGDELMLFPPSGGG